MCVGGGGGVTKRAMVCFYKRKCLLFTFHCDLVRRVEQTAVFVFAGVSRSHSKNAAGIHQVTRRTYMTAVVSAVLTESSVRALAVTVLTNLSSYGGCLALNAACDPVTLEEVLAGPLCSYLPVASLSE